MNTAVRVGDADAPPTSIPYDMRVMCGLLLTKMSLETLAFYLAAELTTMGQLCRPKSRSHIFPTCLYFSLPKGHFLRSQRNSADYICSMATFQGLPGFLLPCSAFLQLHHSVPWCSICLCCSPEPYLYKFNLSSAASLSLFLIEVQLIYNIVFVSGVQQSYSVIYLFSDYFP